MSSIQPPSFDLDWITPSLAVGGGFPSEHTAFLASHHRVKAVVDLRREARDEEALLDRHGIAFLHLPTEDLGAVTLDGLEQGVVFARHHLQAGERVLIHCQHGIGRSATLALCVLVDTGLAPLEALTLAKDRRERVSPSPAQFECFCEWLDRHRSRRPVTWDRPTFEAFAAVAYRHLRSTATP